MPRYELMVLNDKFIIYRSLLFKPKLMLSVSLKDIVDIQKKYEIGKIEGKTLKYTLWGLKDRLEYIVTFKKDGKLYSACLQASNKFIEKLIKTRIKNLN